MIVCVIAAAVCVLAQETQSPIDSNLAAAIGGIQIQQLISSKYATLILDYQSAMGWLQVAQGWGEMAHRESTGQNLEQADLEESADLEEASDSDNDKNVFLQEEFVSPPQAPLSYDDLERSTEYQLLYVLKLLYIQAANKLSTTHQSHYQTKLQLAMLQGFAANNVLGPILYLMYYLETLKVLSSSLTIQRQDAWNTWLLYEILETNEFQNSRGYVPPTFQATMAHSRLVAGQIWQMETSLDLIILSMEYYIQMLVASMPPPQQQQPAAAAPPVSLLEEEMAAEPSQPFYSPVAAAGLGSFAASSGSPQYLVYYQLMLKFWAATMHAQAAQGFVLSSQVDNPELAAHAKDAKQYMVAALQQFAWLKLMTTMMEYFSFSSMLRGVPNANAAASASANNFVQTDAAAEATLRSNQ